MAGPACGVSGTFVHRYINPITRPVAKKLPTFAILTTVGARPDVHTERRSRLPARQRLLLLPHLWVGRAVGKNILATASCSIETGGRVVELVEPELITDPELRPAPPYVRFVERRIVRGGSRSVLGGDAERVDRRVDLYGRERGLRRHEIGDPDRVVAAGESIVEEQHRIALWVWGTNEVCHQVVTLTFAGSARVSRIDRSSVLRGALLVVMSLQGFFGCWALGKCEDWGSPVLRPRRVYMPSRFVLRPELVLAALFGRTGRQLRGRRAKISQPPPASTEGNSSTFRKNARSRSASAVKITA
jgi:hypothetical protein